MNAQRLKAAAHEFMQAHAGGPCILCGKPAHVLGIALPHLAGVPLLPHFYLSCAACAAGRLDDLKDVARFRACIQN
jgi:hypothetical protein